MSTTSATPNMTDYERTRAEFRCEAPERFNCGTDLVDRWAAESPEQTALYWVGEGEERQVSYADLARRSNQVAGALATLGLRRGDRVIVVLPRIIPWWESLTGVFKAGMVAVPGTTLLTAGDLAYRLEACDAAAVIVEAAAAERVDAALRQTGRTLKARIAVGDGGGRPGWQDYETVVAAAPAERAPAPTRSDEPALLYFTSGTTAHPKMVLHTHASYGIGHTVTGRYWLDLRPGDLHWNVTDTGWAKAAWSSYFGPLICGASIFIQHSTGRFAAQSVVTG